MGFTMRALEILEIWDLIGALKIFLERNDQNGV